MGLANIIEGFETDFNVISDEFPRLYPNVKLSEWFRYWRTKSMNLIFANRLDPRDLLEAITAMNDYLINVLASDKWLVALYFLLSISILQPERMKQKIRLSFEDFISLEDRIRHQDVNARDVAFVWKYLRNKQAIDIVESRDLYGPQTLKSLKSFTRPSSKSDQPSDPAQVARSDAISFLEQKLEPAMQEIIGILEPYEALKSSLGLVCDTSINRSIQLTNEAIADFKEIRLQREPM